MDAQLGGNIGTAILSLAPPQAPDIAPARVHVIECSSYQIDLAPSLDPSIGILINLSEDHLDRHGTMAHYADVKARWWRACRPAAPPSSASMTNGAAPSPIVLRNRARASCAFPCAARSPTASTPKGRGSCAPLPARRRRSPTSAASARCAGCTMRRTPPAPRGGAGARAVARGDPGRPALVSRPGAPHGGSRPRRQRAVRQ